MIRIDLHKLRLGAHCVGRLSAVRCISTEICILVLGIFWSARADGPRVRSLTFRSRDDLRLGIPIATSVNREDCWLEDSVRTAGEGNGLH